MDYDTDSRQFTYGFDPSPDLTLAEAQAAVTIRITLFAAYLRGTFCDPTSPYEAASWPLKLAEAKAYTVSGNAADAPVAQMEAAARGISLADQCAKVIAKGTALAGLEAVIAGNAGRHTDAIAAMTDPVAVWWYDWSTGWPS